MERDDRGVLDAASMQVSKCAVCGLWLPFDNQSANYDEGGGAYSFCPCCGIEFCVDDAFYDSIKRGRLKWLQNGAEWAEPEEKPAEWDLSEQLSNVIYERKVLLEALEIAREAQLKPKKRRYLP